MAKSAKTFLTVQELSQPHRQKPFPSPLIKINLDFSQSNYSKNLDIVLKIPLKCKKNSCWDFIKGDPKVNIYRRAHMSQIFGYKNGFRTGRFIIPGSLYLLLSLSLHSFCFLFYYNIYTSIFSLFLFSLSLSCPFHFLTIFSVFILLSVSLFR